MWQTTLLWVVRYFLYRRSVRKAGAEDFIYRDHARRARAAREGCAAQSAERQPSVATAADVATAERVLGPGAVTGT